MGEAPTQTDLHEAIVKAARRAFSDLFREKAGEHFYYCSLTTTGEGHSPQITAWSSEALARVASDADEAAELKWSYADSPYYAYGEEFFDKVSELFEARPRPPIDDPDGWDAEFSLRISAMESAMAYLDAEGVFGTHSRRLGTVINAEVMPPDYTNVERALRLNPKAALAAWLQEAAQN